LRFCVSLRPYLGFGVGVVTEARQRAEGGVCLAAPRRASEGEGGASEMCDFLGLRCRAGSSSQQPAASG
jgi:hypothetical protein